MMKGKLWWIVGGSICVVVATIILLFVFQCQIFGHQYNEMITPATCVDSGYTSCVCKICGNTDVKDLTPKLQHEYYKILVPATCTDQGYSKFSCKLCGDVYTDDYTPVREHRYKATSTTATCGEPGISICMCVDCGYSTTQEQAALGHNFATKTNISATCTGIGIKKSECTRCGEKKEETSPKLGHDWYGEKCDNCGNVNPEYVWKRLVHENGKTLYKMYLYDGKLSIKCTYKGTGNFWIKILDDNQDFVKLVCNEIGSYVVDTTVNLAQEWYYVEIYVSSGNANWTIGGCYVEYHLGQNAIKDFRNAHPDEICSLYDLLTYTEELGIPFEAIDWDELFDNPPEGYFNGAAFSSDEEVVQYFITRGFSRDAIIKYFVDSGGYYRKYSYEEAAEMVDKCY